MTMAKEWMVLIHINTSRWTSVTADSEEEARENAITDVYDNFNCNDSELTTTEIRHGLTDEERAALVLQNLSPEEFQFLTEKLCAEKILKKE